MPDLRLAFYGDDFTGSVDVLLQTMREGWRSRLFLGLPDQGELERAAKESDAVGIAGISRSLPMERLASEVRPALESLALLKPHIIQYKVCSTADSSPEVGNIGRVIEVARELFSHACSVPVLFAQPDFGRYTSFGHHFAADDGVVYRLDRQPTMSHHPVTPMHESELAKHLSRQTHLPIGSLHFTEYSDGAGLARELKQRPEAAVVLDALSDQHITLIGEAVVTELSGLPRFIVGSGGLSRGIARALPASTGAAVDADLNDDGPTLAVSGSRSPQTNRQVGEAVRQGWTEVVLRLEDKPFDSQVADIVLSELAAGRSVVVTTGADANYDAGLNTSPVDTDLVAVIAARLAAVVESALRAGATRRVIICGGDTSSRVVGLLGARSLTIAANPIGNVVVCAVASRNEWLDGVEVLLKGGQVGPVDLFERIRALRSAAV